MIIPQIVSNARERDIMAKTDIAAKIAFAAAAIRILFLIDMRLKMRW